VRRGADWSTTRRSQYARHGTPPPAHPFVLIGHAASFTPHLEIRCSPAAHASTTPGVGSTVLTPPLRTNRTRQS
jgi:hypothetical protein